MHLRGALSDGFQALAIRQAELLDDIRAMDEQWRWIGLYSALFGRNSEWERTAHAMEVGLRRSVQKSL